MPYRAPRAPCPPPQRERSQALPALRPWRHPCHLELSPTHAYPRTMSRLIQRFLGSGEALARLQDHAARLRRLQGTLEAALPAALAEQCRVANCKDGTLVVSTRNGATAVRLKQMLPSLLEHFARTGHVLDTIKVKVGTPEQVEWRAPPPERHISATAKQGLSAFAESLPVDSPLREALERLVRRGRE